MRKLYATRFNMLSSAFVKSFFFFFLFFAASLQTKAQVPGQALSYDGVDDYTTMPAGIVQNVTGSFTIETWIYWRGGSTNFPRILDFGTDGNNWIALVPAIPFGATPPRFAVNIAGTIQNIDGVAALATNTWIHLAVVLDAAGPLGGQARLYVNGNLDASIDGFTHRLSALGATPTNWLGGTSFFAGQYYNGIIDELRISDNIRYTANFTPPTTAFTDDANTVALYRFEEGNPSQTSVDLSTPPQAAAIRGSNGTVETIDPAWINPITLPIRLTDFSAFTNARGVNLKWIASLDMASVFEVQRSSDGISFATIGTITENAGTNGLKTFTLADAKPLNGKNIYRLKYTEVGGPTLYSKIVSVNFSATGGFVVYPNPVKGNAFTIDMLKPYTGNVEIILTNNVGAVVYQQKIVVTNSREIRISKLPVLQAGNYMMQVSDNNSIKESRMLLFQ